MSMELTFTPLTALLAATLWLPFIVGVNISTYDGDFQPGLRPPDMTRFPDWVQRANRAHLNLLEQFLPFAVVVLIGHAAGARSDGLGWLAAAFFAVRCAHAVGYVTGWAGIPLRPVIFTTGYAIILAYAGAVALA